MIQVFLHTDGSSNKCNSGKQFVVIINIDKHSFLF